MSNTNHQLPLISIVTPVFNQVNFIEQTILSIINQDYPNFEYIIVDGGSDDGTVDIIKKYESQITSWISEPDNGMYDALNKGYRLTSGEIMAWINGDDIFLPGAFYNMFRLFNDLPDVQWIQGLNSFIDLQGIVTKTHSPRKFSLIKFLNYDFQWIQQESTFWRRNLWEKAGGRMDDSLKLAGDFELWLRFSQLCKLYITSIPIGAWRKREGQLSGSQLEQYLNEVYSKIEAYETDNVTEWRLKRVRRNENIRRILQKLKVFNTTPFVRRINEAYKLSRTEIVYSDAKQNL